ncbi:MAG: hypothetical protein AAGB12_10490 [Pseudomonadota bacterium]
MMLLNLATLLYSTMLAAATPDIQAACQRAEVLRESPMTSLGVRDTRLYLQEKYVNPDSLNHYQWIDARRTRDVPIHSSLPIPLHHIANKPFLRNRPLLVLTETWLDYHTELAVQRLRSKGFDVYLLLGGSHRFIDIMQKHQLAIQVTQDDAIAMLRYGPWWVIDMTHTSFIDTLVEGQILRLAVHTPSAQHSLLQKIKAALTQQPLLTILVISDQHTPQHAINRVIQLRQSLPFYHLQTSPEDWQLAQQRHQIKTVSGKSLCAL